MIGSHQHGFLEPNSGPLHEQCASHLCSPQKCIPLKANSLHRAPSGSLAFGLCVGIPFQSLVAAEGTSWTIANSPQAGRESGHCHCCRQCPGLASQVRAKGLTLVSFYFLSLSSRKSPASSLCSRKVPRNHPLLFPRNRI